MSASVHEAAYTKGMARASGWRSVEKAHLQKEPFCRMCGGKDKLQVHHIIPFADNPELELDADNLVTLCEFPGVDCHLRHGHLGSFHTFNPKIKEMAVSAGPGLHAPGYVIEVDPNIRPVLQVHGTVIEKGKV